MNVGYKAAALVALRIGLGTAAATPPARAMPAAALGLVEIHRAQARALVVGLSTFTAVRLVPGSISALGSTTRALRERLGERAPEGA